MSDENKPQGDIIVQPKPSFKLIRSVTGKVGWEIKGVNESLKFAVDEVRLADEQATKIWGKNDTQRKTD